MPITLHFGVIDVPYGPSAPRRVRVRIVKGKPVRASIPAAGAETTMDVAKILEAKYHVFEVFMEENERAIGASLVGSMKDAVDRMFATGQVPDRIFPAEGQPDLQALFVQAINQRSFDGVIPGVPTAASKGGANLRKKRKGVGEERPSFRRTGLYMQSARIWVDET
jgi:hypothetical protein